MVLVHRISTSISAPKRKRHMHFNSRADSGNAPVKQLLRDSNIAFVKPELEAMQSFTVVVILRS